MLEDQWTTVLSKYLVWSPIREVILCIFLDLDAPWLVGFDPLSEITTQYYVLPESIETPMFHSY